MTAPRLRERHAADARLCALHYAVGRIEACAGAGCPFWEEGGAVLPGGCLIRRLALDLERHPELADALLHVRRRLELAVSRVDEEEARSLFYQLVPQAREEDP